MFCKMMLLQRWGENMALVHVHKDFGMWHCVILDTFEASVLANNFGTF